MDKTWIYEHRLIQKVLTYTHLWGKMKAQGSFHIQGVSKSDFVEGSKDDVLSPTPGTQWDTPISCAPDPSLNQDVCLLNMQLPLRTDAPVAQILAACWQNYLELESNGSFISSIQKVSLMLGKLRSGYRWGAQI